MTVRPEPVEGPAREADLARRPSMLPSTGSGQSEKQAQHERTFSALLLARRTWRAFSAWRDSSREEQPASQDFAFFEGFDLPELLRATAWRTSALKAGSSTSSPAWMSIARRTFPSRLALKRRAGSCRDAPLAKVSFTTFL